MVAITLFFYYNFKIYVGHCCQLGIILSFSLGNFFSLICIRVFINFILQLKQVKTTENDLAASDGNKSITETEGSDEMKVRYRSFLLEARLST